VLAFTKFGGKGLPALEQAETDKSGKWYSIKLS
jgi:hypothetical protein